MEIFNMEHHTIWLLLGAMKFKVAKKIKILAGKCMRKVRSFLKYMIKHMNMFCKTFMQEI